MSTFGELAQILTIKNKVDGLRHTVDWLLKDKESLKKQVEIAKKALQEYAEIGNVASDALNEMEQEQKQRKDFLLEHINQLKELKIIEVVHKD